MSAAIQQQLDAQAAADRIRAYEARDLPPIDYDDGFDISGLGWDDPALTPEGT
ncbi:hypothetical protein [Streptomyces californicus]|uniref:hypothetical protein n=1 Tax=Streptomyces californicus TaxID=67351 RepID=UPI000ABC5DAB|nr:hypothetical protein [Streptomyces californicus]QRV59427.1 hypothetical protein I6J40_34780 [Streptomyces californicus]